MSWIRSDKALLHHPKTAHLKVLLGVDTATVIGRLHMLWWWCLDYALDGNLSKHPKKVIEDACQIPIQYLIRCQLVDATPRRRIHDWWDNQGNYLKLRFRDQPDIWMKIRDSYAEKLPMGKHMGKHVSTPMGTTMGKPVDVDLTCTRTDVANGRTDVDLTRARGASLVAPPALSTERPKSQFVVDHFLRWLTPAEKIQTKLREGAIK